MQVNANSSLESWLKHIYSLHPAAMKLDLNRISVVAEKIDLTNFEMPVITVAGTNGKGSTVAALTAIYKQKYSVGTFSSPHLFKFNERIKLNNLPVSDHELVYTFDYIKSNMVGVELTFFEFTTLAALLIFKQNKVDLIILEVGLGGKLDATNIATNDLAIITSIGLDHMNYLGNTKDKIALEKAGIIKQGTSKVVLGKDALYTNILARAKEFNCSLLVENKDFFLNKRAGKEKEYSFSYLSEEDLAVSSNILPNNLSLALAAVNLLHDKLPVGHNAMLKGAREANLIGRQQVIYKGNTEIILDLAHNLDSVKLLADFLSTRGKLPTTAVWHSFKDKDLTNMIAVIRHIIDSWYICAIEEKRGSSIHDLTTVLLANDVKTDKIKSFTSSNKLFDKLGEEFSLTKPLQKPLNRIVIFGGFKIVEKAGLLLFKDIINYESV